MVLQTKELDVVPEVPEAELQGDDELDGEELLLCLMSVEAGSWSHRTSKEMAKSRVEAPHN